MSLDRSLWPTVSLHVSNFSFLCYCYPNPTLVSCCCTRAVSAASHRRGIFSCCRSSWGKGTFSPLPRGNLQQLLNSWCKSTLFHAGELYLGRDSGFSVHPCHLIPPPSPLLPPHSIPPCLPPTPSTGLPALGDVCWCTNI